MKNRTIIGIICMLLAIGVAFGVAPLLNRAASQKVDVVKMAVDLPQGKMITENDVKIVTVGAYNLSPKAIRDKSHVIGWYAATDLKEDAILLDSKITDEINSANDVFRTLDGSQKAISITLDSFAGGLSGKLRNGDIVSVITTKENQTTIPAELKYVRVITTTSSTGTQAGDVNQDEDAELPSTVTLLVNERQATILASHDANGKLHLSLVYRGSPDNANKFLEAQAQVFLQESEDENE